MYVQMSSDNDSDDDNAISIGQPGSMHDTSVLYHALDKDRLTFPHPPKGEHLN